MDVSTVNTIISNNPGNTAKGFSVDRFANLTDAGKQANEGKKDINLNSSFDDFDFEKKFVTIGGKQ
jgi:hypothetical protein